MVATWYAVLAVMLSAWAVLDGFDFGAGIVQRRVAKTEEERGVVLAAIGPVWDGNEVWLVAAGGVFFFAFPHAYAVALSGMYIALMIVLWLLVLRGAAIELRGQVSHALWRAGWDAVFAFASTTMAFVAGVALANVIRGVPIDESGSFHLDLFAFGGPRAGAIDAYAGLVGLLAVAALATHAAAYLAWKTTGDLRARSAAAARHGWWVVIVLAAGATAATASLRPEMFVALGRRPWLWPLPAAAIGSPLVALRSLKPRRPVHGSAVESARAGPELRAFLASSAFIASLLLATAGVLFPVLLPSTVSRSYDIEAYEAASGRHGLALGLTWWLPAMGLAVLYFVNLFRSMRGKVTSDAHGH